MSKLVVRPILAAERERFDRALEAEHWLGARLVGEVMRYVAIEDGQWCALVGFGASALCVRSREALLGWSDDQRHRRLRFITNNQRFCVLAAGRRPNLASEVLGLTLRRLSADFEARWRHPVVAVETFTDPALHVGTCYKASNFTALGTTSGYGRRSGRFVYHGAKKVYWFRPLRSDAVSLLTACFDHPVLYRGSAMRATTDLNCLDFASLLAALNDMKDPRKPRGIRHRLPQILAVAVIGALRGGASLAAIGAFVSELGAEELARLGCRISPSTGRRNAPEESTIRRMLRAVDADELDAVVNTWVLAQVRAGRLKADQIPEIALSVVIEEDESAEESGDDTDDDGTGSVAVDPPALLPAVALDGKTLRGARLGEGRQVHLVSVFTHEEGATIAQRNVDTKTNEITAFRPLLEPLDLEGTVVTADALHTQRAHDVFLVEEKGAHYVFGLKDNQPTLAAEAERLLVGRPVAHETHEKGHGRLEDRYLSFAPLPPERAAALGFPHAAQFVAVRRERAHLDGSHRSTETSLYVTDMTKEEAGPKELAVYIRRHWGIENRSHNVRDRTFQENLCQARKGSTPQALATIRNLVISMLRLVGFTNIAAGLRWMAWDLSRSFQLLGL